MDSLTQIVLGAACGEAAMGKKLGNKAMFWGAVGGTIPDLDVLFAGMLQSIGLVDEMWALSFHRGITHSMLFGILMPFILGPIIAWHYRSPNRKYHSFIGSILVFGLIAFAINYVFFQLNQQSIHYPVLIGSGIIGALLIFFFYQRFFKRNLSEVTGDWKPFAWVFFWSIFTHPLLDSCTTFGTQLFLPFSNYRVGFNNIAVADLFYTLPFLAALVITRFMAKGGRLRKIFLWAGIGWSCIYLMLTVYNKQLINKVFERSLAHHNIDYHRCMTSPSLFSNYLWSGTAETEDAFYQSTYSFNDKEQIIPSFRKIPKNHVLIKKYEDQRVIRILKWFSNNYYAIMKTKAGDLQLMDLRFGSMTDKAEVKEEDFVFRFILKENENGVLEAHEGERVREDGIFEAIYKRTMGERMD